MLDFLSWFNGEEEATAGADNIGSLTVAAKNSFPNGNQQKEVARFMEAVEAMPTIYIRMAALVTAANCAHPYSLLEQEATAYLLKDAEALEDLSRRAEAYSTNVHYAKRGTKAAEESIAGFVATVEKMPRMSDRIAALTKAMDTTTEGSDFEIAIFGALYEIRNVKPNRPESQSTSLTPPECNA